MTNDRHCLQCKEPLNASDRNCWRCGSQDISPPASPGIPITIEVEPDCACRGRLQSAMHGSDHCTANGVTQYRYGSTGQADGCGDDEVFPALKAKSSGPVIVKVWASIDDGLPRLVTRMSLGAWNSPSVEIPRQSPLTWGEAWAPPEREWWE